MYHFPNPSTRPSVLALAPRQRTWLFQAFFALGTANGHLLTEQSGSEDHEEHQWVKWNASSLWTGPFLDGISGDTTRIQQCGLQQCLSEVLELLKRIKSTIWTLSSLLIGRKGRLGRMACSEIKSQRPPGREWRKWPWGAHVAHKLVTNDWT